MEDDDRMDNQVLGLLCGEGPLTVFELEREMGGVCGADAVERLVRRGLAHRIEGGFVIASAAGRHANAIDPTWG